MLLGERGPCAKQSTTKHVDLREELRRSIERRSARQKDAVRAACGEGGDGLSNAVTLARVEAGARLPVYVLHRRFCSNDSHQQSLALEL